MKARTEGLKRATEERYSKIAQLFKKGKEPKDIPKLLYKRYGLIVEIWTVYDAIKWLKRCSAIYTNPDW